MSKIQINKKKIVNDPVYGFINIPFEIIFDLIEHPYFQRLRRIKQLGLTNYVYPGANHTRFQHAIGAAHLMGLAIQNLRLKGLEITENEAEAALIAVLLHDIGHGPFSHTLENSIIEKFNHEDISTIIIHKLNNEFNGRLSLALNIFNNRYKKKFLHQLVSSQLDMDRLDYLRRDSFFTGVTEGIIGSDRIIKMLNVVNDQLVIEAKGIYSIEKFLIARRLMYWQVYFHKTVIAAEFLLLKLLKRAKELTRSGVKLYTTPSFEYFLKKDVSKSDIDNNADEVIENFVNLDDNDIIVLVKEWIKHPDIVISSLSRNLINRNLPKIKIQKEPFKQELIEQIRNKAKEILHWNEDEIEYAVFADIISINAYSERDGKIKILYNTGELEDIAVASDIFDVSILHKTVKKYFLCYPKNCGVFLIND